MDDIDLADELNWSLVKKDVVTASLTTIKNQTKQAMPSNKCSEFFKQQDQLGSTVNFNYKGDTGFGTPIGGFFSLLATTFFTMFMMVQMYAWAFQPSYNETISETYLARDAVERYTISTNDFIPFFNIIENAKDPDHTNDVYNDR